MSGTFASFPTALVPLLQTGFLEREMEEGLDSILAYRREALQETINCGIGETLTRTRKGRKAPATSPLSASGINSGLDNGLTPSSFSIEQYTYTLNSYGDTVDTNLMQQMAGIASQLIGNARNSGVQAAQSLERIARLKLFGAYLGGNTHVRTDLGAGSSTTCHVNDIRGFQNVLVNGVLTAVSSTNTLTVQEVQTVSGGQTQTLTVTGVTADVSNNSFTPDGISGVLTFSSATTPINGDAIVASNAPKILRPFGKLGTNLMNGGDVFTMGLIEDGVAYLRDNAVPPMSDGTYHLICDNTSLRQLFADQDFKVLYAGRSDASAYRDGDIIRLLGVTIIPTTEAYLQNAGNTQSLSNGAGGIQVRVRRPILMGAESILQGNFEGLDIWLNQDGVNAIGDVTIVNNVAQIIRPPLDRLQQNISLTWTWVGDFAVPSDATTLNTIVPTANANALYKRCVAFEHAG